MIADPSGCAV